jgi:heavy metal translocating P-type ATPase
LAGDLTWLRVGIALILAGQGMVFGLGYNNALQAGHAPVYGTPVYWALHGALAASALAVAALLGPALWRGNWAALKARQLTVESLFLLTASGAFVGSVISTLSGEGSVYYEVVGVVLAIYTVGRKVGARTRERALLEASRLREEFSQAYCRDREGDRRRVDLSVVSVGDDNISVEAGEAFTVDGVIVEGRGEVQETAVSGELHPVLRVPGDPVFAGSLAFGGPFRVRVTATRGGRVLDRVLGTVEGAARRPSQAQVEADRLMRYFLPLVATVSGATFVSWFWLAGASWWSALFNAMAVLLVACPCALGLATPIAIWSGLVALSRRGLVGRNGALLDALARAELWVFDKTGTLSEPDLEVGRADFDEELTEADCAWLRAAISSLEEGVAHPVAQSLARWEKERTPVKAREVVPGCGVVGLIGGRRLAVGRPDWCAERASVPLPAFAAGGKARVAVLLDEQPVAMIALHEKLRPETEAELRTLAASGADVRIFTGDRATAWPEIAGVTVEAGITPEEKAERVQAAVRHGTTVVFVGDGLNDAAAMAEASASLAMGDASALSRATADGVLLGNRLSVLSWAQRVAQEVARRLQGNLRFALVYNLLGMGLAAAGQLHPVVAALLMLGSSAWVSWRASRLADETEPTTDALSGKINRAN